MDNKAERGSQLGIGCEKSQDEKGIRSVGDANVEKGRGLLDTCVEIENREVGIWNGEEGEGFTVELPVVRGTEKAMERGGSFWKSLVTWPESGIFSKERKLGKRLFCGFKHTGEEPPPRERLQLSIQRLQAAPTDFLCRT